MRKDVTDKKTPQKPVWRKIITRFYEALNEIFDHEKYAF